MTRGDADALYNIVVEADPNLVFIADAEGRIVRVNSRWLDYTGVDAKQMGVERAEPLGVVHPDDLDETWTNWKHSIQTGERYEVTYRLRSARDGRYRWFLARGLPYVENGEIIGWYVVATDIDAQVRANEASRFFSEAAVALTSSLDHERIIDAFLRVATWRFCDGCAITLLDENRRLRRAGLAHRDPAIEARGREKARGMPIGASSIVARVYDTRQSVLIPNTLDPARRGWLNAEGIEISDIFEPTHSVLAVPLTIADQVRGTIAFISSTSGLPWDEQHLEVGEAVARQVATALEHAAAFARERESTERFRYLAHATDLLFASGDVAENVETVVQSLVGYWADWTALYLIERDGSVRVQTVAYRDPAAAGVEEMRGQRPFNPEAETEFQEIVARHRSRLRTDVTLDSLRRIMQPYLIPLVERLQVRSLLIIPLFAADTDFGAIGVYLQGRNYSEADRELFEELGRRVSLALEHAQSLGRERRLVRTLQEVTLPVALPQIPGVTFSVVYEPATASDVPVGGDWYDAFTLSDGRVVLTIGDVAGSGLQASAIMGKLRHAINAIAIYERDPARILDMAEYFVLQRYADAIVTAFVAIFDPVKRVIRYANAGHVYPLLRLRDGSVEPLAAQGVPIGLRSLVGKLESRSRSLDDAALLVFYTDGVTEVNRDIEQGERRLHEALRSDAPLYMRAPATLIAARCLPEGAHADDAALMVVAFPRSTTWSFDAENARAAQHVRGEFLQRLRSQAGARGDFGATEIIFGELIGNVVRHAPGPIDVALEWNGARAVLHVIDRGSGFVYAPPAEVDLMREEGRGLWLIHHFGLHFSIEPLEGFGTHVSVELPVTRRLDGKAASGAKSKKARTAATARD